MNAQAQTQQDHREIEHSSIRSVSNPDAEKRALRRSFPNRAQGAQLLGQSIRRSQQWGSAVHSEARKALGHSVERLNHNVTDRTGDGRIHHPHQTRRQESVLAVCPRVVPNRRLQRQVLRRCNQGGAQHMAMEWKKLYPAGGKGYPADGTKSTNGARHKIGLSRPQDSQALFSLLVIPNTGTFIYLPRAEPFLALLSCCLHASKSTLIARAVESTREHPRQAKDETLRRLADRIQARASRRCGELLKQVEPARGANQNIHTGVDTKVTRESAATDAGLSKRQKDTALRVASIPAEQFEQLVESDSPPTVSNHRNTREGSRTVSKPLVNA